MRSVLVKLVSIAALATSAFAQFTINTPTNVVVCLPVLFTWSGGTPPYFLSILPGAQPSAPALEDLGQQTGTSYSWIANIAVGTSIGLTLRDSVGLIAQSAPFTILNGTDSTCVGKSPTSSAAPAGSTSAAATTPAPATTTAAPAPITTTTKPATAPGTTAAGATTAKPTTTTAAKGAAIHVAPIGAAGIFGAVAIALLA